MDVDPAEVVVVGKPVVEVVRESAVDGAGVVVLDSCASSVKESLYASESYESSVTESSYSSAGVGTVPSSDVVASLSIEERISPSTRPCTDGITNVPGSAAFRVCWEVVCGAVVAITGGLVTFKNWPTLEGYAAVAVLAWVVAVGV